MSYRRVIPRDLFNEANLLKCMGRLYINLETAGLPHVVLEHDGKAFDVQQDPGSGDLSVANVVLKVAGQPLRLQRRLNSREPYPLYLVDEHDEEIEVLAEDGTFSAEALAFFRLRAPAMSPPRERR